MASSFNNNRHWPSMFRSKHAAEPWGQTTQPDDIGGGALPSLLSGGHSTGGGCGHKYFSSGHSGGEERTPDPKPRWNPRPEQIRILESIFNSGMINPPRDEIPRIRMRLQEYGQVGDANVFYWFQNRKSRSKNKLRGAGAGAARTGSARAPGRGGGVAAAPAVTPPTHPPAPAPAPQPLTTQHHHQVHQLLASPAAQAQAPTSSSSSSSDRSSGSSKPAAQPMSATAAMDLLGPLAAACPQMYYHQAQQPVAPTSAAPAHRAVQQDHLVACDDETTIFQQWPQGCCLSATEVAAILGGQYAHAQQQPPALPAGPFLGLCNNEAVTGPTTITGGHRTCAWGAGLVGQFWTGGGADHHHQLISRNNTAATNSLAVAREVAHDDATKLGLLQYSFGVSTPGVEAAAAVPALAASPDAAVTVASVAAATTAGLTGLPASTTAPNGVVVANYDLLQGLPADGGAAAAAAAVGVTATSSSVAPAAVAVAAATTEGVAALCITDSVTGKSVAHNVAAARLDVRAHFGEAAALFRCVGERGLDLEHVPVDASSGCTVEPLQHGAFYYVLV
ncbi:hypothetical protein U9M48_018136 [Paspalum notatum var. saurae]|uniref:Homeobox domain-containing protein n=1 Tax=Paspalum notatum var. saurae TaxID=547442 RepID=A0AAQ3WQ90_PASNO